METLEPGEETTDFKDPRAPRKILNAEEGEALLRRLAEPARKPTPAMLEAVRMHKRLLSERSNRSVPLS